MQDTITIQDCLSMAEKGYEIYIADGKLVIKNEGE